MAEAPKAGKSTFQMPTDRAPTPEEVARYIKEHPELERPLIFPNHQGKFIAFSWLACTAMSLYFVFWHDWPMKEHCFSPIRRYAARWKERLFSVSQTEEEAVQKRIEELKKIIDSKQEPENNENLKTNL